MVSCNDVAPTDFGSWSELQRDAIQANDAKQKFLWETKNLYQIQKRLLGCSKQFCHWTHNFFHRRASLSYHAPVKRAILFLCKDIKRIGEGNNLVELRALIHTPAIDIGLFFFFFCVFLLVSESCCIF